MTLIACLGPSVFRPGLDKLQDGRAVQRRLVHHGDHCLEGWKEQDMLIGRHVRSSRIEFRIDVFGEFLPIHLANGDGGQRVQRDGRFLRNPDRQQPIQLQVLADRASAGEDLVGVLQLRSPSRPTGASLIGRTDWLGF